MVCSHEEGHTRLNGMEFSCQFIFTEIFVFNIFQAYLT